jgi:histidinol-phosphate aminotransferase
VTDQTPPRPRDAVAAIPAYVAGKPPAPRPGRRAFKLSSNENPYPPLPGVVEAAQAAVAQMNRYPDMGNGALYDALAARLGVPRERLAAGTGSVAVLYHLLQAFCDAGDDTASSCGWTTPSTRSHCRRRTPTSR